MSDWLIKAAVAAEETATTHGAAAHHAEHWPVQIWLAVAMAILVIIAWKPAKKAILGMLDGRIDAIRKQLEEAASLKKQAEESLQKQEALYEAAMQDAEEIKTSHIKEMAALREDAIKDFENYAHNREIKLKNDVEHIKKSAIHEINEAMVSVSLKATRLIISETANDTAANQSLTQQAEQSIISVLAKK
ncbi:MAG: hypothetical protein ACOYK8_01375 [Alphaproteobacteria bacterium]